MPAQRLEMGWASLRVKIIVGQQCSSVVPRGKKGNATWSRFNYRRKESIAGGRRESIQCNEWLLFTLGIRGLEAPGAEWGKRLLNGDAERFWKDGIQIPQTRVAALQTRISLSEFPRRRWNCQPGTAAPEESVKDRSQFTQLHFPNG